LPSVFCAISNYYNLVLSCRSGICFCVSRCACV